MTYSLTHHPCQCRILTGLRWHSNTNSKHEVKRNANVEKKASGLMNERCRCTVMPPPPSVSRLFMTRLGGNGPEPKVSHRRWLTASTQPPINPSASVYKFTVEEEKPTVRHRAYLLPPFTVCGVCVWCVHPDEPGIFNRPMPLQKRRMSGFPLEDLFFFFLSSYLEGSGMWGFSKRGCRSPQVGRSGIKYENTPL